MSIPEFETITYDDRNNTTSVVKTAKPGSAEEPTPISLSAAWDQTWNKPLTITSLADLPPTNWVLTCCCNEGGAPAVRPRKSLAC